MQNAIERTVQISGGLAKLGGKKLKFAISELQSEGVITREEAKKLLTQMSKVKKVLDTNIAKPLKKAIVRTKQKVIVKQSKKRR